MSKCNSGTAIEIVTGARPPMPMRMRVSIEADNLPGLAIEVEAEVKAVWRPADHCWDTPEVSLVEAHITRCGVRVAVTVPTLGQWREIERAVERYFEHSGHDEIMRSGNMPEVRAA